MNGPVASAGSILSLSNANGIKVPNIEANTITINKAIIDDRVNASDPNEVIKQKTNRINAQIVAIITDRPNSLRIFLKVLS